MALIPRIGGEIPPAYMAGWMMGNGALLTAGRSTLDVI